jgi:hypothetical protein
MITNAKPQCLMLAAAVAALLASGQAGAHQGLGSSDGGGLTYVSPAYNNAIYSYRNVRGAETPVADPQLTYVSRAFGQAIPGYAHVTADQVSRLSIDYVNPAYGQAIFSYESAGLRTPEGSVEVLPDGVN